MGGTVFIGDFDHAYCTVALWINAADHQANGVLSVLQIGHQVKGVVIGFDVRNRLFGAEHEVADLAPVHTGFQNRRAAEVGPGARDVRKVLIQREGLAQQTGRGDPHPLELSGRGFKHPFL